MNTRTPGWEDQLAAFIERKRHAPFAWGTNDCCLFAADWVLALLEVDPATAYRGTYSTALGAARTIEAAGGVVAIATGALSIAPDEAAFAGRGDIVSYEDSRGTALGVCVGPVAAFVSETGLMFKPLAACKQSWRII